MSLHDTLNNVLLGIAHRAQSDLPVGSANKQIQTSLAAEMRSKMASNDTPRWGREGGVGVGGAP